MSQEVFWEYFPTLLIFLLTKPRNVFECFIEESINTCVIYSEIMWPLPPECKYLFYNSKTVSYRFKIKTYAFTPAFS
jgi:hypothetical protein